MLIQVRLNAEFFWSPWGGFMEHEQSNWKFGERFQPGS
jgi:hypothetical protein